MFIDEREMDELGRVVIPHQVRRHLGLRPGDKVLFLFEDGRVVIEAGRHEDKTPSMDPDNLIN